jgi:hypothetical protein
MGAATIQVIMRLAIQAPSPSFIVAILRSSAHFAQSHLQALKGKETKGAETLKRNTLNGHVLHLIKVKGIRISDEKKKTEEKNTNQEWGRLRRIKKKCGETKISFIFQGGPPLLAHSPL